MDVWALCCGEQGRPRNAKKALGDLWQKRMMKLMGAEQGTLLVHSHIRKVPGYHEVHKNPLQPSLSRVPGPPSVSFLLQFPSLTH